MPTLNIIGLGGYLRSGKDTVADYLVERHGYTKIGMSDPLLQAALVLDPIIPVPESPGTMRLSHIVDLVGYTQAKQYPEVRRFLQVLGTEVGRNMIDQNLWVNLAMEAILTVVGDGGKVALTGVRFLNELHMIQQLGGTSAWLSRPDEDSTRNHASENSLTPEQFDRMVLNHGTLEDLYWVIDKWMEQA